MASWRSAVFRLVALFNGLAMIVTGLYGVFLPASAMGLMTGLDHAWDAETISLMRMHNGADFGLGLGFILVGLRPTTSFAAFVLCLFANVAHGIVHVIDEIEGHHHLENMGPIFILIVMSIVIAALYPWKAGLDHYRAA